jgi:signal transduction histidine kinase
MRSRQRQFEMRDRIHDLAEERARLSALLDNLPVGVNFADPSGRTVLSNPSYRRFLPHGGPVPGDTGDRDDWQSFDNTGQRRGPEDFAGTRALRGETVEGVEALYRLEDGQEVWTQVSGVPLRDAAGKIFAALTVIVDVDTQKRAQETLQRSSEELENEIRERTADLEQALDDLRAESEERERAEMALRQSQKMEAVGQLTGGIAHDFNNMLAGIVGSLDLMKRRLAAGELERVPKYLDAAMTSAQRAAALTARLLAFGRRQSLDLRSVDVNAVVASLDDLLQRTLGEGILVEVRLAEDLWSSLTDSNQLENALLNLAINARDAMPEGGRLTITTRNAVFDARTARRHAGLAPGEYVVIDVADTGTGMSPDTMSKVFEPFFTTKPIGQGTGLGLSMIYGFVKQSDGHVEIDSTVGEGTAIRLFLPRHVAVAEPVEEEGTAAPDGKGETVLVVEDEPLVRMLIVDVLEELNYTALEAASGDKALPMLQSGQRIDLLVTDVGLPGMNGRQLAELARGLRPELKILFVTGYAEKAAVRSEFLGENMEIVTKPFALEALATKIREMIEG